jgi:ferredoxin
MRRNNWKIFRVIISIIFLVATAFIFLDFASTLPSDLVDGITFIQFVPSLLKFLEITAWIAIGFIIVTIFTLLFGRVYCSTVCPLGIMQDVFSYFSRKTSKKRKRYKYSKPRRFFRYGILIFAVLSLLTGSIIAINLLDPFSNFGKIMAGLGRPLYYGSNNILVRILESFDNYSLYPVETKLTNYYALIYPAFLLGLIAWMSLKHGRLYCNTICPVGTFLGMLSKLSIYKIKIKDSTCTRCGKCAAVCKSGCINVKDKSVDFSRCVGCFNCLNTCEYESIGYKSLPARMELKPVEVVDNEKRSNITKTIAFLLGLGLINKRSLADERKVINEKPTTIPEDKEYPVSPPGSISLNHFNDSCTACHLCVAECPTRVLQPSLFEYGLSGILQPRMDYHASFCNYDCKVCSEVCPTGAILSLNQEEKHTTRIGKVNFIKENCVVYTENTACGACAEHCPTKAVRMVDYKNGLTIPETEVEICVGCGACEYACPVRPYRAIYVDGNLEHQVAKKPEVEELDDQVEEDFPF